MFPAEIELVDIYFNAVDDVTACWAHSLCVINNGILSAPLIELIFRRHSPINNNAFSIEDKSWIAIKITVSTVFIRRNYK